MSSPTSSSSLDSVFELSKTGTATPSSISSAGSTKGVFSLPTLSKCRVSLTSAALDPKFVAAAFDKYAERGLLALQVIEEDQWVRLQEPKVSLLVGVEQVEILISHDGIEVDYYHSVLPTDLRVARGLTVLALASLRAVLTVQVASPPGVLYLVEQPAFVFPPLSHTEPFVGCRSSGNAVMRGNIPTLEEWKTLWSSWNLVTLKMIPHEMLHQKPIDLRHKCLFYIGHIPTFLDMLLSKSIGGQPSEPAYFWNIFERGIDPHVDNPEHCHGHSEVPKSDEDWPTLDCIISFRNRVHARLANLYDELSTGKRTLTRNIARTLVMTLEHEGWHVETLLYMLIQRAGSGTLPPPGFTIPRWDVLKQQWEAIVAPSMPTVALGPATVTLGHDDSEADDKLDHLKNDIEGHIFGWDNESPQRQVSIKAFRVDWRPVTNGEFEKFWRETGAVRQGMPSSWLEEGGEIRVRTLYGPVPMAVAQNWPVLTSYDNLSAYARSKGGRLPTEPELRLFLDTYDVGYEEGANVGFRNWHPIPATTGLAEHSGKGSNGGVWEWTATLFDAHEGLSPTNLFTGYSTDFFDEKHHVVLGASYATIPRLAGRRTVRNFWQHNYPYPWVGGRVAYDL